MVGYGSRLYGYGSLIFMYTNMVAEVVDLTDETDSVWWFFLRKPY